jgi:hypothetical protein
LHFGCARHDVHHTARRDVERGGWSDTIEKALQRVSSEG